MEAMSIGTQMLPRILNGSFHGKTLKKNSIVLKVFTILCSTNLYDYVNINF